MAVVTFVTGLQGVSKAPASAVTNVFQDDFETGNLTKWTNVKGLVVQGNQVFAGSWAARATGPGQAFAWKKFGASHPELDYEVRFKVLDHTDGAKLLAFRGTSGPPIVYLGITKAARLYVHNQVVGIRQTSATTVSTGAWHLLQLRARTGASGNADVWLDGVQVDDISGPQNLGGSELGRVDVGDSRTSATFDVAFDDVDVATVDTGPPPGEFTIAAAGDIACDPADPAFNGGAGTANQCAQMRTSDLLVGQDLDAVLVLGDAQYECGGFQAFLQSYDPSWGRVRSVTYPVVGNHEYNASGGTDCDPTRSADGYFDYFEDAPGPAPGQRGEGWYSLDLGDWHLTALNTNCSRIGGCSATSTQGQWFSADLAANPADCTLAYGHHPRWSSGTVHGDSTSMANFYKTLHDADGEIFLSGHDHGYERFALRAPNGSASPTGVRQFVSGAGGGEHYDFAPGPHSQIAIDDEFGVLFLTLQDDAYEWAFVAEDGDILDSGSASCH